MCLEASLSVCEGDVASDIIRPAVRPNCLRVVKLYLHYLKKRKNENAAVINMRVLIGRALTTPPERNVFFCISCTEHVY